MGLATPIESFFVKALIELPAQLTVHELLGGFPERRSDLVMRSVGAAQLERFVPRSTARAVARELTVCF
jgi:hypothetical protein